MKTAPAATRSPDTRTFSPKLQFDGGATPVAGHGLGGLIRDHFGNGRMFATVAHHGGLTDISYWGQQHLGAAHFFNGALETGWNKLFRFHVTVADKNYYPTLSDTRLYPFGFDSHFAVGDVTMEHELLLLPDALVQRVQFDKNPRRLPLRVGMVHHEEITATGGSNRTWTSLVFKPKLNAFIASCLDINPPPQVRDNSEESLAQIDRGPELHDSPHVTSWVGLGCDLPFKTHDSLHARFKHYILSDTLKGKKAAFYLVFAKSRPALEKRLKELSKTVHRECDVLVADYESRLRDRPQIDVGNPILNSAFMQFPEMIHHMKLPDVPGAARATLAGYFVWGWDGMMPLIPSTLANEPEYTAESLRFFQKTLDPRLGIPHSFSTGFQLKLKGPFPSQCQFIASLYHYVSTTGDLELAKELYSTCKFILDKCRRDLVKNTGLVSGAALWPDFPEALDETGHDISSINNSLLYQGLRAMEYLAHAIGEETMASECRDWSKLLRINFLKYLYDADQGYFISSCSSIDFKPRKHYCGQAIFWITPFARELVSHAPTLIAKFMDTNLRSSKCLLTLPHWDTAWMADGNQLGSSYPAADYFYLNVHKLIGDDFALKAWLGDVEWFWRHHTAPEALTPEAENEDAFGPDNWGGKQCQSCTTWYASLYMGLAGLDFDHEGLTITPWGDRRVTIKGVRLRGVTMDFKISGRGTHLGSLKLNGKLVSTGLRKIAWKDFKGKKAVVEIVRTTKAPSYPVILRADGLAVTSVGVIGGKLTADVSGQIDSEIVVAASKRTRILVNGLAAKYSYQAMEGTVTIPIASGQVQLEIIP